MLAYANRLSDNKTIEDVKSTGKKLSSKSLVIIYKKVPESVKPSRFCIVVSTHISKSASVRNNVKRAFSEGLRQYMYKVNPGFNCVVIAKTSSAKVLTRELMPEIQKTLSRTPVVKK